MAPRFWLALAVGLTVPAPALRSEGADPSVGYNRDVRPILSDACFKCHGPDGRAREADLRLDTRDGLFSSRDDAAVVVPEKPAASLLFQRLIHPDPEQRMPPVDSGKHLTTAQIATLRTWIEQGAAWEDHWAFIPPQRPQLPALSETGWARTAIDRFVAQELERRDWKPQAEANPETLVRRVTLDLTGLPPTVAELDAYLANTSPDRYERLVDRLLASPRYGEHLAAGWLDAARYADTSGYQNDGPREMWRWRDWVIAAFNDNLPFAEFTIRQLAGDLLLAEGEKQSRPDAPTTPAGILQQVRGYLPRDRAATELLIATGFQRNHRGNAEGGIIAEEYAVEYVADRVDTAGATWLGLTVGCARCHSHKYDPISQADYYRLFAYFNQVPEYGRAIKEGNSPPYIKAPTAAQWEELRRLEARAAAADREWERLQPELVEALRTWEQNLAEQPERDLRTIGQPLLHVLLDETLNASGGATTSPTMNAGEPQFVAGPRGSALQLDGRQFVDAGDVGKFGYFDAFSVSCWIKPGGSLSGGIVSRTTDDAYADGWTVLLDQGHLQVNLVKRWLDDSIRVETEAALAPDRWQHIAMTYDGSRTAQGIAVYVNGEPQRLIVHYDFLNQNFANKEPLRLGSVGSQRRLEGALADVQIYRGALSPVEASILAVPESVTALATLAPAKRTPAQAHKLQAAFLAHGVSSRLAESNKQRREAHATLTHYLERTLPTTMVMVDLQDPRPTAVLQRGVYDKPGELVESGVPAALTTFTGSVGGNRLEFARWLVDRRNPLTARVIVNRIWQRLFGTGLVKTSEDFGIQGEPPSHPDLLDWLAVELIDSGWDLKHLQRLIVTSAAYRQSSHVSPELAQADPENRWLARGPRLRLSAEMIRDQALAVSGLLEERLGGPSIKPYQPDGLWQEIATDTEYVASPAPDLYRRSVYCFVKRTVANPTFALFDAATREACTVQRGRTNTPLQALTVWNDTTFVEAARVLAQRALNQGDRAPRAVVERMFRRVAAREPREEELADLLAAWQRYHEQFQTDGETARALLSVGSAPVPESTDAPSDAAFALIASILLNLDEVVTKE